MKKWNLGWRRPLGHVGLAAAALAVPLAGCGGASESAPAAKAPAVAAKKPAAVAEAVPAAPSESSAPAAIERPRELPAGCEPGSEPCSVPASFVAAVCKGRYPSLALVMMAKGTPWTRAYVKAETVEPVNMYEGERSERWLEFGEEVLILRQQGNGKSAGVSVSGPTDVDVLRWDGTCATVRAEMLRPYPTNTTVSNARIVWKYLDAPIQEALLTSEYVRRASEKERPACKGSTMKSPGEACDKASRKLNEAITVALRGGLELPTPEKLPDWRRESAETARR